MTAPDPGRVEQLVDEVYALRQSLFQMRDLLLERIENAYLRKDTHALEIQLLSDRIKVLATEVAELKAQRDWVGYLIIGAVIVAMLGLVIVNG